MDFETTQAFLGAARRAALTAWETDPSDNERRSALALLSIAQSLVILADKAADVH